MNNNRSIYSSYYLRKYLGKFAKAALLLLFTFFINIALNAQTDLAEIATKLQQAIEQYEQAKRTKNADTITETALQIAAVYEEAGLTAKAIEYYQIAHQKGRKGSLKEADLVAISSHLAAAYLAKNQLDSALIYEQKQLRFYQKNTNIPAYVNTLQTMARIYEAKQDLQQSLTYHQQIQQVLPANSDKQLTALNNLGYAHHQVKDYAAAIAFLEKAEQLNKTQQLLDWTVLYTNLGVAHANNNNWSAALAYFQKAKVNTATNSIERGQINHLMADYFMHRNDLHNAGLYNADAMKIAERNKDAELQNETYATQAKIHQQLYEFEPALDFYNKHLQIKDSLLLEERLSAQSLSQYQFLLEQAEQDIKLKLVNEELNKLTISQLELEKDKLKLVSDKLTLEAVKQEDELRILKQNEEIQRASLRNKELAAIQAQQQLAFANKQLEAAQKDRALAEAAQKNDLQAAEIAQKEAEKKERQAEIDLLNREQEVNKLKLASEQSFRENAYLVGSLFLLLLGLMVVSYWYARRANSRLAQKNTEVEKSKAIIEEEKSKSDALLLNILPAATAQELKETGEATPQKYEQVTVLFSDFRNFTNLSENLSPEELIKELNTCFLAFDEIIERHNLEKIKTIGDAYMCAGGIPIPNTTNPLDAVQAAQEMQEFMAQYNAKRKANKLPFCDMRVGIHTGTVIAGVVGKRKFAYDIWGDAVNLASRMESNGEAGKVNISADTFELVKDKIPTKYRGKLEVKNKGKIGMYFVEKGK